MSTEPTTLTTNPRPVNRSTTKQWSRELDFEVSNTPNTPPRSRGTITLTLDDDGLIRLKESGFGGFVNVGPLRLADLIALDCLISTALLDIRHEQKEPPDA